MLRVHGPSGPRDFEATSATVGADGSLVLALVEVRSVRDPTNLAAPPQYQVSNPQLVRIISAGRWTEVENLDLEADQAPAELAITGGIN